MPDAEANAAAEAKADADADAEAEAALRPAGVPSPPMRRAALIVVVASAACDPTSASPDAGSPLDVAATDAPGSDAPSPPDAGPPLVVGTVVDLGVLPHPSDAVVGRDGVSSGRFGGRCLWTFGDTFLFTRTPWDDSSVVSATSAWSGDTVPLTLDQPVDANGVPAQLIPYTDDELAANRADPLNGWALWPGAVIDTGDPEALVLFQRIKRTEGGGFEGLDLGTARIGLGETVASRDAESLFSRPPSPAAGGEPLYGAGGVSIVGETAYFFVCDVGECSVARVPRARADQREAFEFFDGSTWVTDITSAEVVLRGASAVSVSWNAHLGRYLAISSRIFSNDVVVRTAPAVEGPWPRTGLVIAPAEGGILAAGEGFNYLALEQPCLASGDGSSVVISYSRPLGSFRGEVRLARITFE